MAVHGLLLAAGAGTRMGGPKALVRDPDGRSWVERQATVLRHGGCRRVTVVLGAGADEARALLADTEVEIVEAEDWAEGMSASLRTGLLALGPSPADAALVSLVDLPDLTPEVVRRVAAAADGPTGPDGPDGPDAPDGAHVLARAAYGGTPGHPVLLGRAHWAGVLATAAGDAGARDYLATHAVRLVECGDLATGEDRDHP